jgi:predicted NACHT family NTPase
MVKEFGNSTYLERGLKLGKFVLFFDGLNEIPDEEIMGFVIELNLFRSDYPENKYIILCRGADYSDFFLNLLIQNYNI